MSKLRFSLALAVAAGLLAWWWAEHPAIDGALHAAQGSRALAASGPPPADLQFQRRALSAPSRDPFGAPPKPPPVRDPSRRAEVPPPPKAPPLPYQYDGNGVLQGKSFVFLKRQNRTFMVGAGDTLEGTYAVETVARDRVVLRYLPLGIRQVMMYATGAEAPPEVAAALEIGQSVALQVDMPAEVVLGQEFVVTVGLPAGALKATVEVGYDAEVLSMVDTKPRRPGRAIVEVASAGSASRAQLRFKVLADAPVFTDIDVQVRATDAGGRRVPVSAPSTHTVSLVLPGA
jgi:hypothetical protein